jgi:hypothetical protein
MYNGTYTRWSNFGSVGGGRGFIKPYFRKTSNTMNYVFTTFLSEYSDKWNAKFGATTSRTIFSNLANNTQYTYVTQTDLQRAAKGDQNVIAYERGYLNQSVYDDMVAIPVVNKYGASVSLLGAITLTVKSGARKEYSRPPTQEELDLFNLPGEYVYPLTYYDHVCIVKNDTRYSAKEKVELYGNLRSLFTHFPDVYQYLFAYEPLNDVLRQANLDTLDCQFLRNCTTCKLYSICI